MQSIMNKNYLPPHDEAEKPTKEQHGLVVELTGQRKCGCPKNDPSGVVFIWTWYFLMSYVLHWFWLKYSTKPWLEKHGNGGREDAVLFIDWLLAPISLPIHIVFWLLFKLGDLISSAGKLMF